MLLACGQRFAGVTGPKLFKGDSFPLVTLSTVLRQFDRGHSCGQSGQQSASADLGELARVATERELGIHLGGSVEDGSDEAGPGSA